VRGKEDGRTPMSPIANTENVPAQPKAQAAQEVPTEPRTSNDATKTLKPPASLIIFDWDDTLFPTSTVNNDPDFREFVDCGKWEYRQELVPLLIKRLEWYDIKLYDILCKLDMEKYAVTIVTNAEAGWYLFSIKLLPRVQKFLAEHKIKTVYAREEYANAPSQDLPALEEFDDSIWPLMTKITTYQLLIDKLETHITRIFAIGDREWDTDSLRCIDVSKNTQRERYTLILPYDHEAEGEANRMLRSVNDVIGILNSQADTPSGTFSWQGDNNEHAT